MRNPLLLDIDLAKPAALPVRRPSTALVRVVPNPLPKLAMKEEAMCRRLDLLRMSNAERHEAIDALLLGRDIGRGLLYLGRAVRRWLRVDTGKRHLWHASFRNLIRMRRARLYRASRAILPSKSGRGRASQ